MADRMPLDAIAHARGREGDEGCLESPMLVEEWLVREGGGEGADPTAPPPAGGVR